MMMPAAVVERVRGICSDRPQLGIVLGSGLGAVAERMHTVESVDFRELHGFGAASVPGHVGRFVAGYIDEVPVLVQLGRIHAYEGESLDVLAAPFHVMSALGVRAVVSTNAAGSLTRLLRPGDLVLIADVVNADGHGPAKAPGGLAMSRGGGTRPSFDSELSRLVEDAAKASGVRITRGVYAATRGPAYETRAEVSRLRNLGAHVVGMSLLAELHAATAAGLPFVGLSVVTNLATGLGGGALRHRDVLEKSRQASRDLGAVLELLARHVASFERAQ